MADDFYIGYVDAMPAAARRAVRTAVAVLMVTVVLVAASVAALQSRFAASHFDLGSSSSFVGALQRQPYPRLWLPWPGSATASALPRRAAASAGEASALWLTVFGKRGAESSLPAAEGGTLRVEGTLIHRRSLQLLEVASAHEQATAGHSPPPLERFGRVVLHGEIVDSKCYAGVMKPGRGKAHRSCAARCIAGGVAPMLRVRTTAGETRVFALADVAGRRLAVDLSPWVAEPVRVAGELVRRAGEFEIHVASGGIERVP